MSTNVELPFLKMRQLSVCPHIFGFVLIYFCKLIVTCLLGVITMRELLYWYPIVWCSHYYWNSCWVLVLCLPRIYIDLTEIILAQWRLLGLVMLVLNHLMWSLQLIWRLVWIWGSFCLFVLECLELRLTFSAVDILVVWLRYLAGKIFVVHIISMRDIYHNFLCNRWFSRLAKFLDCKDLFSLLLIILKPRSKVLLSSAAFLYQFSSSLLTW